MYANDMLLRDADLWRYWNDNNLVSNVKGVKKLQRTFIEKVMQLHRIMYYA